MLCSKYKQILFTKTTTNNNVQLRCYLNTRFASKKYGVEGFWSSLAKHRRELLKMTSVRFIFRDIGVNRLWSAWTRNVNLGHIVRTCRRDRNVREVLLFFRQTFTRPRRNFILSAAAVCKANEYKSGVPPSCSQDISDEDMESLIEDLEGVDTLAKQTLYCAKCKQRLVIDKKYPGVKYCLCKESVPPDPSPDGWVPYMEADDVIIWRQEYKPGQGLYAYKVYGRYKDVHAKDYADVNLDGAYRRRWDSAVAALSVVERSANGVLDQAVLHWEVLWPRLFANRDYVYIRRHKEFSVKIVTSPHIFEDVKDRKAALGSQVLDDRPNVHSNAKKKSIEKYSKGVDKNEVTEAIAKGVNKNEVTEAIAKGVDKNEVTEAIAKGVDKNEVTEAIAEEAAPPEKTSKVFVIVSRSCTHHDVPQTRNAIRVHEYWSHMLVRTLDGADEPGMEFVLTYYDEPAVGGMPSGVTTWVTGRAAPAYLQRIRLAAKDYGDYKKLHKQDTPDFTPFHPETKKISFEDGDTETREEDMESSKTGPDLDNEYSETLTQGTQTEENKDKDKEKVQVTEGEVKDPDRKVNSSTMYAKDIAEKPCPVSSEKDDGEKIPEEEKNNGGWWRYLYPLYYFV